MTLKIIGVLHYFFPYSSIYLLVQSVTTRQNIKAFFLHKKVRKIPTELRRLFARLLLLDVDALSTVELTDSFGWARDDCREQQDIQVRIHSHTQRFAY